MTARDDYPLLVLRWQGDMATVDQRIEQHEAMCDEIDRLRAAADEKFRWAVARSSSAAAPEAPEVTG